MLSTRAGLVPGKLVAAKSRTTISTSSIQHPASSIQHPASSIQKKNSPVATKGNRAARFFALRTGHRLIRSAAGTQKQVVAVRVRTTHPPVVNGTHHLAGNYDNRSTDHLLPHTVMAARTPHASVAFSGRISPSCCVRTTHGCIIPTSEACWGPRAYPITRFSCRPC